MGAGGIIQEHAKVLLSAAMDQSVYDNMSTAQRNAVELIGAKDYLSRDEGDVRTLLSILNDICGC